MNSKELAEKLSNIEYPPRLSKMRLLEAKDNGLVIVYGASDDLMEFEGAINDEIGCCGGGEALVDRFGLLPARESIEDDDELKALFARQPTAKKIEALWCKEPEYSWTFKTDIPHETFEIVEAGQPFCRGLVFSLGDL